MSTQEQGDVACRSCDSDSSGTAGRSREVEKLDFHKGTRVRFSYHSEPTRSTILVSGQLEKITRGAPGQPTILKVDRLSYHVPPGTLVTVETGEIR